MPLNRAEAGTTQTHSHVCIIQIFRLDLASGVQAQRKTESTLLVDHWFEIWEKDLTCEGIRLWSSISRVKDINQWVWVCTQGSFIQIGKCCVSFSSYLSLFSLFLFLPFKKINFKMEMTFWMKHSSSFWKCWYKAFWHFLKPFSFMCACVYEDYLKDETWPYKFILVDGKTQVEVCIKMYFFSC